MTTRNVCSICGRVIEFLESTGPGPHKFHNGCINGAFNFIALTKERGGDVDLRRMAMWPNAEKAGITNPFDF